MPELPEVEANARNLAAWATGRTIVHVIPPPGTRETGGVAGSELARRLAGRRVVEVMRRGKWILVRLSGGAGLALHLGMTGKIARARDAGDPPRFTRAVFALDDGVRVCFVDSRRFGRVIAEEDFDALVGREEIAEVGPDALALELAELRRALSSTRRKVKDTIMDQRVVSGVGNLYATEALWHARIHPATPARQVAEDASALRALHRGIRRALDHGLRTYQGVDLPRYVEEGGANPFFIYDRTGERCRRCGSKIRSIKLAGRTTAFCPSCQPASRRRHRAK